jgi:hypothetical protein
MIKQRKQIKIHYVSPYDIGRNFGKAINEACKVCKPDEWVCIRDGDTMFLHPDWGLQIEESLHLHGEQFDLIGCMTNRLNDTHQLHNGEFSEESDIREHMHIANYLRVKNHSNIEPTEGDIAAMFMLIPYRIISEWQFEENRIDFDRDFCQALRLHGMRLGIMTGLYIFHLYRMWAKHPAKETNHLYNYESRNSGNNQK